MIVDVYAVSGKPGFSHKRGEYIARAMMEGLQRCGVECVYRTTFDGQRRGDLAVAYGWVHEPIFRAYGQYVYWDLGYWNRRPAAEPREGLHRLALHDWDTATHLERGCPGDRLDAFGPRLVEPIRLANQVALIAGMSAKAAMTHGYAGGTWEQGAASELRALNWRPIQRPKVAKRMTALEPIDQALMNCGLLATHHSNCAVDAVVAGVPVWAVKGVGRLVSSDGPPACSAPRVLTLRERQGFLADLAYAQWTPAEMRSGEAWAYIRERLQCT